MTETTHATTNAMTKGTPMGAPWYRCFWPWFIVGLLSTAVVASLTTVAIAVSGSDPLVRDDYFRDGMAINRRLDREATAQRLGVAAELRFDEATGDIGLDLRGAGTDDVQALAVSFSHPTRAERDVDVVLHRGADRVFRGSVDLPLRGRFYLALAPAADETDASWRLSETVAFEPGRPLHLGATP